MRARQASPLELSGVPGTAGHNNAAVEFALSLNNPYPHFLMGMLMERVVERPVNQLLGMPGNDPGAWSGVPGTALCNSPIC